ncbi:sulfurtransferase [Meridianimaribacter flavus]|uniref:Thiosulfate/3-mercaptopyruvate sulfurtransferase n=1 Tax=Meridianimaribacter flavus TaxID=571115 RepID=A0ABY2G6V4_9FLAO|nr:sulfurtransferase [Meridianimaribacter flavus]TDY12264.1 thiosulfate/3-mercaptopyruvate sulfurtransferase [Meridianimaribacter flavus]
MLHVPKPLVSVHWLNQHLAYENLIVLDATIGKVTEANSDSNSSKQIATARFFDIKQKFSDTNASFPNTFPSVEQFTTQTQALGIHNDSCIVVYDDKGIYSSARVWWMFKTFGFNNIAVLDGGLPEWIKHNYPLETKADYSGKPGSFTASYNTGFIKFFDDVVNEVGEDNHIIVDARSQARFSGEEPEPRAGLRSGNIPGSFNIPYTSLLENGCFKDIEQLQAIFKAVLSEHKQTTFTCGSGITACVLALGAELSGYKNLSIYDGSWTEWGSLTEDE